MRVIVFNLPRLFCLSLTCIFSLYFSYLKNIEISNNKEPGKSLNLGKGEIKAAAEEFEPFVKNILKVLELTYIGCAARFYH